MKKRKPSDGDPVYVYVQDEDAEGGRLGYWQSRGPSLMKANDAYSPLDLSKFNRWFVAGTVQKIVDAPAPKRRRR
jgi:hypothetical protein